MNRPYTPLADSYMRARLGLPADFDLDSVPFAHLEDVAAKLKREAEAERKKEAERQKALEALQPPKVIAKFITSAGYLKGDRHVGGIAVTGAANSHGQVLCAGGADIYLPVPLLINHDSRRCVGSVEAARIDEQGAIHIWASIDRRCDAQTWRKIQGLEFGCFSGAADPKTCCAPVNLHGVDHFFSWRLGEVSLCEVGANHQCLVTEIWPPNVEAQPSEVVGHVEQTVETIANTSEVARSIDELAATMRLPIKSIFDKSGKLIGAQRVDEAFEQFQARIEALEERLPLAYAGTWSDGQESKKGMFYTCGGSIWFCRESTHARPGTNADFQLAVKRGAAGKDAG